MIEDLRKEIEQLIALYEQEKQRADVLSAALAAREDSIVDYKQQIADLKSQIDKLKLAGAFVGGADSAASKERINKLIREIDKCIRLIEN